MTTAQTNRRKIFKKVNIDGKSGLARLLAIENLSVRHDGKAETASFDLKRRIVTLPILKEMTGPIYDWFIAHEISHALNTPGEEYIRVAKEMGLSDLINITEDIRIERMIKDKYPGTRKDCYKFYKELSSPERDFFQIKGKDLSKMNLANRINLKYKCGDFVQVPFKPEEQKFLNMCDAIDTFEDAEKAAYAIMEEMKKNNEIVEIPVDGLEFDEGEEGEGDPKDGKGKEGKGKSNKKAKARFKMAGDNSQKDFDKSFAQQAYEPAGGSVICGDIYRLPQVTFNKLISKDVDFQYQEAQTDVDFTAFMSKVKPAINMMAATFNQKKAAHDYQRTQINKTGRMDMSKISDYKIKSDIFLRNELVPEAKNHGMVMMIDWSGSMQGNIDATIKQLVVLMEFCRKVSIPFEVYGFTTFGESVRVDTNSYDVFASDGSQALFLMFDSTMKKQEYQRRAKSILENYSQGVNLGSTPLNMASFLAKDIMINFRKKTNVEKTTLVILSDGGPTDYVAHGSYYSSSSKKVVMRDPMTNKNYNIDHNGLAYHDVLAYAKEAADITNLVGFYLTDSLSMEEMRLISPKLPKDPQKVLKDFKEKGVAMVPKGVSFDRYYAVSASKFEIDDNQNKFAAISGTSSKQDLKDAFIERLTRQGNSFLFLKNFVELIS